ncbi:MAG: hypothetical protein A3G75_04600 [Verrucomicrobia bacterium RIFCSPLOWO2_12_FULL_64_8]|nr:MAG: hypothetical protein A3G75_04600 [Verrucomicrobia bacterium RIFCSPLOWO2_12_FULL_64_8]
MKKTPFLSALMLWCLVANPLAAADSPAATVPSPMAVKEMAAVEQFLNLSDAELDQMLQVIGRIRAMKPEERAALRREIAQFRQLPEPQRQQLRQGWGWMPPEIQDGWRAMMQKATPERHAEIQAKLQSLPAGERATYRRQLVEEYLKQKAAKK